MTHRPAERRQLALWLGLWAPGLLVAIGAGVATAHGLYEVAAAAGVPAGIAWLYPLITDGLALVAYASTARLVGSGRGYAWAVVVLAAGLSGLAQASYLADGLGSTAPEIRFGVGAWPAVAAAIVAHLLFLLGHHAGHAMDDELNDETPESANAVQSGRVDAPVQPAVQPSTEQPALPVSSPVASSERTQEIPLAEHAPPAPSPARDRARAAARRHASLHGGLPTVTQLMDLANVARGTAGNALKELRDQPTQLHVVNDSHDPRTNQ